MTSERRGRGPRAALAVLFAVGTLGMGVAACGDDEDESSDGSETAEQTDEATESTESAEEVTVTATEYAFDLSATPSADTERFTLTNDGKEFHLMVLAQLNDGFTLDEAVQMQGKGGSAEVFAEVGAPPGKSETVDVKQEIGSGAYVMICPVMSEEGKGEPHYKLGQIEEFDIE